MPSDNGASWAPPAGTGERRLSNSSDGSAGSGYSKATTDSDYLQTRVGLSKVVPGKPATNPLQFVKVGPCDLYRSAQEQLRRAEEVKKSKEVKKEELEDWQSNLDNWKSCRRKRVEHIIERCVEVRRMENEPVPGARGKSKTFNEMLEQRAGKRRICPLQLYTEEEVNDLSDLGIGTSSTKSSLSEDCDTHSLASDGIDLDKNHSDVDNLSNCDSGNRKLGSSANEYDTCTTTTISSPEPEEYTYESAIEGYKSRISSQTHTSLLSSDYKGYTNSNFNKEKTPDKISNGDINRIRTTVSNKIEDKVSSLKQNTIDVKNNNQKKDLPKVDILKRRETFEKESSPDSIANNKPRFPEIANKKSIKERLSSLEKFTEETQIKSNTDLTKLPKEVVPLKERLSNLEKIKVSVSEFDKSKRLSNSDLIPTKSVKERLSSLKSQTSEEEKIIKTEIKEVSISLKERLNSLDNAKNKEITRHVEELNNNDEDITKEPEKLDSKEQETLENSLTGIEHQMQNFCRSLDSLDINGASSPSSFERVQSFEDFESCQDNQNNTSPSDIETEDSGIHTARGSCAPGDEANEMAELIQLETSAEEPMVEISEYESSNEESTNKTEPAAQIAEVKDVFEELHIEEIDDDSKIEDTDSVSNYIQAVSQPMDDLSATDEITEIQMDRDDEDTLKSLDPQDTSVIDALELAFQEIDATESDNNPNDNFKDAILPKHDIKDKLNHTIDAEMEVNANEYKNENKEVKHETKNSKDKTEVKNAPPPLDIFYPIGDVLETVVDAATFPLDLPPNALEPPKEKPPPPPMEDCVEDDVALGCGNFKSTNSTRRIKKEIRNKRTSFLGLEGQDDSYLDVDLKLAPRPDITSFLQEETKIEKLLYKKTLSHDMDSKLRESRDSGVDLDRGPSAEAWYNRQSSPEMSNPHSRQNSEPYTQMTVTSDEEESAKKQQFNNNLSTKLEQLHSSDDSTDDVQLEHSKIDTLDKQLREQQECVQTNLDEPDGLYDDAHTKEVLRFERELLQLEQEELRRQRENLLLRECQTRRKQKSVQDVTVLNGIDNPQPQMVKRQNTKYQDHRHSMPNLLVNQELDFVPFNDESPQANNKYKNNHRDLPFITDNIPKRQNIAYVIDESSRRHAHYMPEESPKRQQLMKEATVRYTIDESTKRQMSTFVPESPKRQMSTFVPESPKRQISTFVPEESPKRQLVKSDLQIRPPVPVTKPRSKDSMERELTMRSSRVPSAVEYVNIDKTTVQLRPKQTANGQLPNANGQMPNTNGQYQQMSRHSLQALSAVPTPKLISGSEWLQARSRKQIPPAQFNYNQHWLIQEAEQRRIEEQRSKMRAQQPTNQRHSYHQDPPAHNTPASALRMHGLSVSHQHLPQEQPFPAEPPAAPAPAARDNEKMLSVSGRKKCSHCGEELGRGAAMIIESLSLCYHVWCFSCVVCGTRLGDGRAGADVRVRARRLHCHQCYSSDDGRKFSCV